MGFGFSRIDFDKDGNPEIVDDVEMNEMYAERNMELSQNAKETIVAIREINNAPIATSRFTDIQFVNLLIAVGVVLSLILIVL